MRDYLQGKRCMVWSFMGNSRMYQALRDYGDRMDVREHTKRMKWKVVDAWRVINILK